MAFSVQMPALGESVTEGTVTRWLKQEGDRVEVDEPLLEVSTDKVDTEIPSPAAGILQRIIAAEDETIEVGGELAIIGEAAETGDGGAPRGGTEAVTADRGGETPAETAVEAPSEEAPPTSTPAYPNRTAEPVAGQPSRTDTGGGVGTPITMPALGESVTEGTITRWLKQVGDRVEVDEPLLEVSTDKVDTEIPSPVAGTVLEITVGEDETVEVGGQLAVVGAADAAPAQQPPTQPAPTQRAEPAEPSSGDGQAAPPAPRPAPRRIEPVAPAPERPAAEAETGERGAPYVTPLVRKLAAEHGVDLSTVRGSGVGGRIRKQDVLAAAEARTARPQAEPAPATPAPAATAAPSAPARPMPTAPAEGPQPGTTAKMSRLRQLIATRMRESLQVSAQLTTVQEVDVTRIAKLRARARTEFERREGVKLTYLPFFARATVEALKQFPQVNASIDEETKEVTYHASVHLAIAVDTPRGLVVPVIKNAEDLNVAGLAKRIADVAARTRNNKIGPDELSGGTFTITNIGSAGALFDTPIINQPQVAILGTGAIRREPKVVTGPEGEDVIAIRSVCFLPLTYDHRLVDGADAGRFLTAVRTRLEEGDFEADLGL